MPDEISVSYKIKRANYSYTFLEFLKPVSTNHHILAPHGKSYLKISLHPGNMIEK